MNYLKSLFFNFLVVFFANHILSGIEVVEQTKLPHLGGDLPFALALGFLNSLIYPVLRLIDRQTSIFKIALAALVVNFVAYALLKVLPIGIRILTIEGYVFPALIVTVGSFLTNFLEMRHARKTIDSQMPE